MAILSQHYNEEPKSSIKLPQREKQIADAVVEVLRSELQQIIARLDDEQSGLVALAKMIQANHHDVQDAHDQLRNFRKEQSDLWEANGEVWNKIDANVDLLVEQWQSQNPTS